MRLLGKIIASILHPATLILPGVFLIASRETSSIPDSLYWTFICFVFTAIVALFIVIGVRRGMFTDIDVSVRKQRVILYPVVIIITLLFSATIYFLRGPFTLVIAGILFVIALIVLDFINLKIKASVHVASVTALVVGLVYEFRGLSFMLLLLIPLIAWARIAEKRHTLPETIVGAIFGIIFTLGAIFVVQLLV